MIPLIEPPNWSSPPDPPLTLAICGACNHELETDQLVETCERCDSDDLAVLTWDRRTVLGAVESWLDGHADAAGRAVAKAVERLANLARRADDFLKERRNG